MFEEVVNEAATRFNLPTARVSALVRGALTLITDERTGGADGFVYLFRRAGLADIFTSWYGGLQSRAITSFELESALGRDTLERLAGVSGMPRDMTTSVLTYLLPVLIGRLTPSGFMPSNKELQSQLSGYIEPPAPAPIEAGTERRRWRTWPYWATAALLTVAGVLWVRGPAGTLEPELVLSNRDGKVTYSGVVRDRRTQAAVASALRATFGEANVAGQLRVDGNVKRAEWLPRLHDMFAALKTPGVEFSLNGNAVNLGGWLSAADRQAIDGKLRGIFGPQTPIGSLGDPALEAVRAANEKVLSVLDAIESSGQSGDAVVRAMNLAIINFPSGSAEIPRDDITILRKCADVMRRAPSRTLVEIRGHTDSTGDAAANLALSQARAEAVKRALVEAGVTASLLTTRGFGDNNPRATNDTEFGRFQNRRIEYVLVAAK